MKNLGLTSDSHLTMSEHVSIIAQTCFFKLHYMASICRFLQLPHLYLPLFRQELTTITLRRLVLLTM